MTGIELFTLGSTLFTIGDAIAGVSALTGVFGALGAGQGEQDLSEFNAGVAQNNAIFAERNAAAARESAEVKEQQSRREARLREGKALAGASDIGGSFLDVFADDATQSELDALTLRYNGVVESNAFLSQASQNRAQASVDRFSGQQAKSASTFRAAGSLLTLGSLGTKKNPVTTGSTPPRITNSGQGASLLGR